jgi:hypothetical protein
MCLCQPVAVLVCLQQGLQLQIFNSINLDGDKLLWESMNVTTCLEELVGVEIFAYVAGAGGANKWMYNLLWRGKIGQGP